jgi:hypothetical protein
MKRASYLLGILAVTAGIVPGCSGSRFTAADENDAGNAGEAGDAGKGGNSGKGGSSSGTAGSDAGGNGNGGAGRGGTSGTNSGGSQTGGEAGEGASGGTGPGGMGGSSGTMGGASGTFPTGGTSGTPPTGGTAGTFPTGGSAGAGSGGAGSGGKGGSGGAGPSMCPPGAPSPNSACSFMGHCSYGTHPLQRCRDVYACDGVRWQQTQDANCATPPSCEDLPTPPVINAQCMPEGAECQGNLYCLCAANCSTVCSFPPIWHCFGTPGDCPAVLPNRGQPCNVNLSCVYGSCASQTGVQAICENGFWVWYGLICPQ